MKKLRFEDITLSQLLLILGLIIIIIPPLLVIPTFWGALDFSDTGEIGDTIGGITAPFINGIGAILVFIAFKEQIKANNLLKEQQYFQPIHEQIQRLEADFFDLQDIINAIHQNKITSEMIPNNIDSDTGYAINYYINADLLNKAIYTTALFLQTYELIEKLENREFMTKKLKTLYKIIYQDKYRKLRHSLNPIIRSQINTMQYVTELLLQIDSLEQKLGD
jgi:hypothetical protein